jgi:serine protease Do
MRRTSGLLACLALVALAACGGDDGDDTTTVEGETTTTADASGAVDSVEGVESATVDIVATGTFADPEMGMQFDQAGGGTGFIVDPSGIVVTNNHVVTGAATLEVHVDGEDRPQNARVLGVSECADLAVIDIEGEGYPYLEWYDEEITTNLDVRAAGFPAGVAGVDYTLTRGIVSRASTSLDSEWASVDEVVQHDAKINPGNSGGPLVDERGRVVGVNYAGADAGDENFAIASPLARRIVDQLRDGTDAETLGINGQAVYDEELDVTGIWVASVKSGSPADQTGVEAGDILLSLEGISLGAEGTMKEYCDVLRSRNPDDVMTLEVLRWSTEEVLKGQINGRELEPAYSFSESLGEEVAEGDSYSGYTWITDDTGAIEVEVPEEWTDIDGTSLDIGPAVVAAPDIAGFDETWNTPGLLVAASREIDPDDVAGTLEALAPEGCTSEGRFEYDDGLYTGEYDRYTDCGGVGTVYIVLAAAPEDRSFTVVVVGQAVTSADLDAIDQALATFQVVGEL